MTVGRLMAASSEASATTSMSSSPQGAAGAVADQWLIVGEQDPVSGPVHIGRERPLGVGDVTITGSPAARACHQALCWHRPLPSPSSVLLGTVWITQMQCVSESCQLAAIRNRSSIALPRSASSLVRSALPLAARPRGWAAATCETSVS